MIVKSPPVGPHLREKDARLYCLRRSASQDRLMHDRISSQTNKEGAEAAVILHCLGNFRLCAVEDGADLAPRGRKARALIAYLVLNGGPVSRERLAGLLWSERGEDQARASLRNALLELRALSSNGHSVLVVEREHIGIVPGRIETDLGRLQGWAASGNLAAVDEYLGSRDGRIFGDMDSIDGGFDEWLAGERTRQQDRVFAVVTAALESAPDSGSVEQVRSIADKLLQIEPTNEVVVRLAMRADRSAKDVSAIRRRYKRLENQLRAEFTAAPSADTRRLYDELMAGATAEDQASAAAAAPGNRHVEPAATGALKPQAAAQASTFARWRWVAVAATVAAAGTAAIAMTASYDWRPEHTADLVELRPLFVLDGAFEGLAQQTHGTLKRVLASHQVHIVDGVSASASERPTNAEFALSGSVENDGNKVGVTLYLDNIEDGQTLWSHQFERVSGADDGLRDEIGAHTAFMISCALQQRRVARVKPTVATFKIYLETCDPAFVWSDAAVVLAVAQRLVEVAPDDAYGHGLVALANASMLGDPTLTDAEVRTFRDRVRKAAARASQLDPASTLPLIANVLVLPTAQSWLERDTQYQRARAYSKVWDGYVHHLRASGRVKEALRVLELCLAQLPLSAKSRTFVAVLHMQLGDHERAHALFNEAVALWPNITTTRWYRFINLAFYGKVDDAQAILIGDRSQLGFRLDEAKCWQTFLDARRASGAGTAAVRTACADLGDYLPRMLAVLGEVNGAFETMRANRMDWDGATISFFYPEMKAVRHDVRFMSTIADSGLVAFWATSGQWPDFCRDKDLPYSCKDAAAKVLEQKKKQGTTISD
jgi:DNA-binding SARP family transcriptional activator/tetratricopeptide (TPR) repeat protein